MSLALVFDVETTGLPFRGVPSDHPSQPHLVSAAYLLVDLDTRQEVETYYELIRPDGWKITQETTDIHGISHMRALARGVPEADAMRKFLEMQDKCSTTVAHNQDFDTLLLRMAMLRYGVTREESDDRVSRPNACTMQMSSGILNLPPTERMASRGIKTPKPPKLTECVQFMFGEEHGGAHDALEDARACARVYFWLLDNHAEKFT